MAHEADRVLDCVEGGKQKMPVFGSVMKTAIGDMIVCFCSIGRTRPCRLRHAEQRINRRALRVCWCISCGLVVDSFVLALSEAVDANRRCFELSGSGLRIPVVDCELVHIDLVWSVERHEYQTSSQAADYAHGCFDSTSA